MRSRCTARPRGTSTAWPSARLRGWWRATPPPPPRRRPQPPCRRSRPPRRRRRAVARRAVAAAPVARRAPSPDAPSPAARVRPPRWRRTRSSGCSPTRPRCSTRSPPRPSRRWPRCWTRCAPPPGSGWCRCGTRRVTPCGSPPRWCRATRGGPRGRAWPPPCSTRSSPTAPRSAAGATDQPLPGRAERVPVRAACCLAYRTDPPVADPSDALCTTCPLLDRPGARPPLRGVAHAGGSSGPVR